jgi:murein DD-endopeptidase MepM/ murein hydrolase activator NlpD
MVSRILPFLVFAALFLSACAPQAWPFDGSKPWAVNRPPVRQIRRQSSLLFTGADAVIVGPGDTVYGLSRRHGVSVRAIIEANRLRPPYHLIKGWRIVLPRMREHVVRQGDTLSSISRKYRIGLYELARLNALGAPYKIRVGQRLKISDDAAAAKKAPRLSRTRVAMATSKSIAKSIPRPPRLSGRFLWPVRGRILSGYGPRAKGLYNDGIDISAPEGTAVRASENGVVAYAGGDLKAFGNMLLIRHAGGWVTAYAYNERLLVKRGDVVRKGQTIALVGSTGTVTRPQLHFEVRRGKRTFDPRKILRGNV